SSAPAAPVAELEDFSPAVRRLLAENNLDPKSVPATGPKGRLTKQDVEEHLAARTPPPSDEPPPAAAPPRPVIERKKDVATVAPATPAPVAQPIMYDATGV